MLLRFNHEAESLSYKIMLSCIFCISLLFALKGHDFFSLFSEIFVFLFQAEEGEGSRLCRSAHIHPHGGGEAGLENTQYLMIHSHSVYLYYNTPRISPGKELKQYSSVNVQLL